MDYRKHFLVKPGSKVCLAKFDPGFTNKQASRERAVPAIRAQVERMVRLQYLLHADASQSLLIVLQGLDASGKDGAIRHLFRGMSPQGISVHSFKQPTREELAHDFLWRIHQRVPGKGEVVVFNRSHYEDVLVTRVHKLVRRSVWSARYGLINDFEQMLAENRRSVLVCLQALDAGGKDGTINHVLAAMNPQGARVHGFKQPSVEEAAHDFLWRAHVHAPRRGEVVVFNRSHYEDVLVVRVHDLVPRAVWSKRYDLINDFERNLVDAGTHVLKFYLHVSADEQLVRFKQRLDDPARQWKISVSDYTERELWPRYVDAYEEALEQTSTKWAPWYVIPANHKWFRDLAISQILADTMQQMGLKTPRPQVDLAEIRRKYHAAEAAAGRSPDGATAGRPPPHTGASYAGC